MSATRKMPRARGFVKRLDNSSLPMPFSDHRRAKRWHTDVEECVGIRKPSHHDFPYMELHQITQEYLVNRKHAEETDNLLLALITSHSCPLRAYGACIATLSTSGTLVALGKLSDLFLTESVIRGKPLDYLEALIATSSKLIPSYTTDGLLARILLDAPYAFSDHSSIPTKLMKDLFSALKGDAPSDRWLLDKTQRLVKRSCESMRPSLDAFQHAMSGRFLIIHEYSATDQGLVVEALGYSRVLSLLQNSSLFLQDQVRAHMPHWEAWSSWKPNKDRLIFWITAKPCLGPLQKLLYFEGPDHDVQSGLVPNKLHGLIARNELNSSLQSFGLRLVFEPYERFTTQAQVAVFERILDRVTDALSRNINAAKLLSLYLERSGIGLAALESFRLAEKCFSREFVKCLTSSNWNVDEDNYGNVVLDGFETISQPLESRILDPLLGEIGTCVERCAKALIRKFNTALNADGDWLAPAEQLWRLRRHVATAYWLHPSVTSWLVELSRQQDDSIDLRPLDQLYTLIQTRENYVIEELKRSTSTYIEAVVECGVWDASAFLREPSGLVSSSEIARMDLVKTIHNYWRQEGARSAALNNIAVEIASLEVLDIENRIKCIVTVQSFDASLLSLVEDILKTIRAAGSSDRMSPTQAVMSLTRLSQHNNCWCVLLQRVLMHFQVNLNDDDFTSVGFKSYCEWTDELLKLGVTDSFDLCVSSGLHFKPHSVLECRCEWLWTLQLLYPSVLDDLERCEDSSKAIHGILTVEHDANSQYNCMQILSVLQDLEDVAKRRLVLHNILMFVRDSHQFRFQYLADTISIINTMSEKSVSTCEYILSMLKCSAHTTSILRLNLHLEFMGLETNVKTVLSNFGWMMGLDLYQECSPQNLPLDDLSEDYTLLASDLLARTKELSREVLVLNRQDPVAIAGMITELGIEGIENISGAAILLSALPPDLSDVVEEASDGSIEFHFPLNGFSTMERLAFGLSGTEMLFAHVHFIDQSRIATVCVHLEDRTNYDGSENAHHDSLNYVCFTFSDFPKEIRFSGHPSYVRSCLSRLKYVVARGFWRLHGHQEYSIESLYKGVQEYINTAATRCIICEKPFDSRRHRTTLCGDAECVSELATWSLNLQSEDIKLHSATIDLLLTAIFATANVGQHLDILLPNLPTENSRAKSLLKTLNHLPADLELGPEPITQPATVPQSVTSLLSWVCNHYGGFLSPAFESYKIPNMPGVLQFLLIDGAPRVEAAFGKHDKLQPRRVLFHGTSLDRLYAVLSQGLRVLSRGPLQKHGAASGPGIYMAREPSCALAYGNPSQSTGSQRLLQKGTRSDLYNSRVLLGCEHAGNDAGVGNGIHVITDPSRVMVRYVFFVPQNVHVPRAQDIQIPMLGAFSGLRASASRPPSSTSALTRGDVPALKHGIPSSTPFHESPTSKRAGKRKERWSILSTFYP